MDKYIDDSDRVVLQTLECFASLLRCLQDDILVLVAEAHFRGASWSEIACRLGRSKQTVHQRYHRQMHSKRTHELLRRDLTEAWRHARSIQLQADDSDDMAALLAFLSEQRVVANREKQSAA